MTNTNKLLNTPSNTNDTKLTQILIMQLLYYYRAIDMTILLPIGTLEKHHNPTQEKYKQLKHIIQYLATNTIYTQQYHK